MKECPQMGPDGKCQGLYFGFTCIEDKCRMQNRESQCKYCIGGDYCLKYNRFGCVGLENCGSKDEYMASLRHPQEKADIYQ
ncbi:MAG TPA: hypothetical protein VMW85_06455 [Methanomassiliicoccales archaeon]|nr:hypothetical protein [Methanomassiliicoccales archaeon]